MDKQFIQAQINAKKVAVQKALQGIPESPWGHAFVWGTVEVRAKYGKQTRAYRCLLASVATADLNEVVRRANGVPGVSGVYLNLD